ncbi:MAG: GNAT family N-acetyltransferase [Defluviitaleaceae bacterium]|nr:GNAT family N-acetyltransferase [Defluviitaleaceae bacterium]
MGIIRPHGTMLRGKTDDYEIVLRPLCDAHLPYLYKWNADSEVLYWSESGVDDTQLSYDEETVRDIYGAVSRNAFCFLIEANGVAVGECWLQKMNRADIMKQYPTALDVRRFDFVIGEKSYWNKGIGSCFVVMLIDFAFNRTAVDVLHCVNDDYNLRSTRMWEKHGFTKVAEEPLTPQPQKGKFEYHWRLTREEYHAQVAR